MIERFFLPLSDTEEVCFCLEMSEPLSREQLHLVTWLLKETPDHILFSESQLSKSAKTRGGYVYEVGPRLTFATPWCSNAISIFQSCGITQVSRIERFRRYLLHQKPLDLHLFHDRMTEEITQCQLLKSFNHQIKPAKAYLIPVLASGIECLRVASRDLGLGWDEQDLQFVFDLFARRLGRDPTNVEIFQLGQANSEHCRHGFFKGKIIIDGREMPHTLMQLIMAPWRTNPGNSIIAFHDNSSAVIGFDGLGVLSLVKPGQPSPYHINNWTYLHALLTAETHNFPTGISPFEGAETGTGGRIRDVEATGRGAVTIAGTAGYCFGNLLIPGYRLPWEDKSAIYPDNLASPVKIAIRASDGATDYGNKYGEPVVCGFSRSFGLVVGQQRWEWLKPIMFTGGVGMIENDHVKKDEPVKGMLIIQPGGPAYRIGFGGGSASSQIQGANKANLDFNAVQRGDAQMEQRVHRVIRACVEMGPENPIRSIHDQGAGGPCNVLTELINPVGGRIEIRDIRLGDQSLSVVEIWVAEYQERYGLLIDKKDAKKFLKLCEREGVPCEILGQVTGDGQIVLHDRRDDSTPVNLNLEQILGKTPQKTFTDSHLPQGLTPLRLPRHLSVMQALQRVLRTVAVGSKGHYVYKGDRSVTGLIARQQGCGPLDLPVSDLAAVAFGHFGLEGMATAIGEQPIKLLVDPAAGARMALGEALTNLVWGRIRDFKDIRCSVNWMWSKLPGEIAAIYDAMTPISQMMVALGIAADGGKDSMSMATKVNGTMVKSPRQMVISAYAPMSDVRRIITPDIKRPGSSRLALIDLGFGQNRLGGSILAQVYRQIGNDTPDVASNESLERTFSSVQELINRDLILSGHDRSDGGLIVTLLEMAFAGNCGMAINLNSRNILASLFSEELGLVIEYDPDKASEIRSVLEDGVPGMPFRILGNTTTESTITIRNHGRRVLLQEMPHLRQIWSETSHQLRKLQINPDCAKAEKRNTRIRQAPPYHLTFTPAETPAQWLKNESRIPVAIVRQEGTNGDREMAAAFYAAGFRPWDINMSDLSAGRINLKRFRGVVFPGGFSYSDVMGSARGWAANILFNDRLHEMFAEFYYRPDTFSLGVCNGCQLMAQLGWVPFPDLSRNQQPIFTHNLSRKFESRWTTLKIQDSPSIMLRGMAGSILGCWVAHGEGRVLFPDQQIRQEILRKKLAPIVYVDDVGRRTECYPFNPNGSPLGITALCTPDGRHNAMMPHPERCFQLWQWPYLPEPWKADLKVSPWLRMFQNFRTWCNEIK